MKKHERLLLPDVWRGGALLGMIIVHALFISWIVFGWNLLIPLDRGVGKLFAQVVGISFLTVAGWSAWLKWSFNPSQDLRAALKKVMQIFFWAGVISLVTLIAFPSAPIWWGVLHCLATALFVVHLFLSRKMIRQLVWLGAITVGIGIFREYVPGSVITVPLGFPPAYFATLDYYPVFPYAGVVWLTACLGGNLTSWLRPLEKPLSQNWPGKRHFLWLGQHSLLVYMGHVPVLLALFWIISLI